MSIIFMPHRFTFISLLEFPTKKSSKIGMTKKDDKVFAVVTGASSGLGRCFALELAQLKMNTLLVALPNENVESVAIECRALGVESFTYEADFTDINQVLKMTKWVNDNFNVNILINNAGCGGTKSFLDCDVEYINRIIQVNITATAVITHQLIHNLVKQPSSHILNVSSIASFTPMGYKTVYPASKRFIQHFSRGLYQELKNSNTTVTVVYPGPMRTNDEVTQTIANQGFIWRIGVVSPEKVAHISINQMLAKKHSILIGWLNRLIWITMAITPMWIKLPVITKGYRKVVENTA